MDYCRDDPMVKRLLGLTRLLDVSTVSRALVRVGRDSAEKIRRLCHRLVLEQATITTPAGTFSDVLVKIDLDRKLGGPNIGNCLLGVDTPDAVVTLHLVRPRRG
jgi:hypothetical protein